MNPNGFRSAAAERPVSVLFVVDDLDRSAGYVAALAAKGWRARVTQSAESAISMAESDPPDVLVTEADVGGALDGFALARRVKSDVSTHLLPVIVITDLPLHELARTARTAGCSGVVTRPCDPDSVIVAVKGALLVADILAHRRAQRDVGNGETTGKGRRGADGTVVGAFQ
jgi:DNA-binding response OmpR family regulator